MPSQKVPPPAAYYADTALGRLAGPLLLLQSVLLVGSVAGGTIARRRRVRLERLVNTVTNLNAALRAAKAAADAKDEKVPPTYGALASAEVESAMASMDDEGELLGLAEAQERRAAAAEQLRSTLERSLNLPAAAHPTERVTEDGASVSETRRELRASMHAASEQLAAGDASAALASYEAAMALAAALGSRLASVATARGAARALTELGRPDDALARLLIAADLAAGGVGDDDFTRVAKGPPEDFPRDDLAGEVGDAYVELGELEMAGLWYDAALSAMGDPMTSIDDV